MIENIFIDLVVELEGFLIQQIFGIPLGTNCTSQPACLKIIDIFGEYVVLAIKPG